MITLRDKIMLALLERAPPNAGLYDLWARADAILAQRDAGRATPPQVSPAVQALSDAHAIGRREGWNAAVDKAAELVNARVVGAELAANIRLLRVVT